MIVSALFRHPLIRALGTQRRIIHALLMREILTRFGRHNIGFLWLFVEPMLFTLGVTILWTALQSVHGSSLPIVSFALTGYSSVLLWRNMPARCVHAILPNLALMYHRNVKVIDILLARLFLEAFGATISLVVLTLVFYSFGLMELPQDVLTVALGWIMLAWFGMALALVIGGLAEEFEMVEKLWHPASYLLFPLSGAGYLVDSLPQKVQGWALMLPMVNGVECVRDGFFGSKINAHYDLQYMATACAVLTLLGLAQVRRVSRKVVPG